MTSKWWTIIRSMPGSKKKRLKPIHPGAVLQKILDEAGLTANALALALRITANCVGAIVKGQHGITPDTALRLGRYFGTSAQIWMNLQTKYELAAAEDSLSDQIEREVLPRSPASLTRDRSNRRRRISGKKP